MRPVVIFFSIVALVAWLFLGFIVWQVPTEIDGDLVPTNVFYFFLTAFVALFLTISLLFYFISSLLSPKTRPPKEGLTRKLLWASTRRAFLLSTLVIGFTALKAFDLLNLLNGTLIIGISVLIEIYFRDR